VGVLTGIESAAANSQLVYLTFYEPAGNHPRLAISRDGGDTWVTTDIEPGIGPVIPYLAAVDRANPDRLYLRIVSLGGGASAAFEGVAISGDAGASWAVPLRVVRGSLSGLASLPGGNLFAVGLVSPLASTGPAAPTAFRSDDGGLSFTMESLAFHADGLGERNGTLYVVTKDLLDGFALASSQDGGKTWRPRLRLRDIAGVKDCVRVSCQQDCDFLAGVKLFPPETCNPTTPEGCGCGLGSSVVWGGATSAAAVVFLLAMVVARQRRRHR
jgi:hypothetical protein